jgi:hypothetical protein
MREGTVMLGWRKEEQRMASPLTRRLSVAATALGGILAGASVDRSTVALPAWRRVGARPWATYSRQADLRNGLILYPLLGIGQPLLTIATAVAYRFDRTNSPRSAALPTYAAAVLSVGHVFATTRAAPNMLSLRRIDDNDLEALQGALRRFEQWQVVRGSLQALTFAANIWSLASILQRG